MKRLLLLLVFITFPLVGMVLGQVADEQPIFNLVQEIGKPRPQGIRYDSNFDQFAYTDLTGRLVLVDAATLQTRHVLYEQGNYSGYVFSHDGRFLALAIDRQVQIWDTQAGTLDISLEPDGVLSMSGIIRFSDDDRLLLFDSIVRAPPELRRSENDTSILPWMWDLAAERGERNSTLPGGTEAYPFFGYRNGLIIGPNDTMIAAIPARLQVLDGHSKDYGAVKDLEMNRIETDPMDVWRSLRDNLFYVRPNGQNNLLQVNANTFEVANLPLGNQLGMQQLQALQGMRLSNVSRIIGMPNSTGENALLRLILGEQYRQYQGYEPITVTLLDILDPITLGREQMGLLVYTFYTNRGYGAMEFIRPVDIVDMELSPDNVHLLVRRASGLQPLELYNLDTGLLEHTYFPAEPDFDGSHTLSFNADGTEIITDFERINVGTAESKVLETAYTSGFQNYVFSNDSQNLITLNGNDWRMWDIATGKPLDRQNLNLVGNVIASSPDSRRYLTQYNNGQGDIFEIVEVGVTQRRTFTIPPFEGRSVETIVHSPDWTKYLVVYAPTPISSHYPSNEIAVYTMDDGKVLFLAGSDLPSPDGRSYRWVDNQTISITSSYPFGSNQPSRIYGLEYDASGVPICLVNAYPDEWQQFVPLWEQFNARMDPNSFGRLTQRLCASLPTSAASVAQALTPTPRVAYRSEATPYPLGIAGVPACLTSAFPRQALAYAEAWRDMSAGLDDTAKAELEKELCEGLITSLGQLAPTPTVDPNQFNAATATPFESGPVTVDSGSQQQLEVMLVDIETGERSIGSYSPPVETLSRPLDRVLEVFQREKLFYPSGNVQLSPDGTLFAITDDFGFIDIYRLSMPYEALVADRTATAAAEQADAPRSLALPATATRAFDYVGQSQPTLTPTVTPTPPPAAEGASSLVQNGEVEDICPSSTLFDLSNPPPDFSTAGRLLIPDFAQQYGNRGMLSLDLSTGSLTYDDVLPACGTSLNCQFSFDQDWIYRLDDTISVSRPDGTDATVLFENIERAAWPDTLNWVNLHTLRYEYTGWVAEKYANPVRLYREFDPITGQETPPSELLNQPVINELPTTAMALQPVEQRYWLMNTDYGGGVGTKYYLYDLQTNTVDYFARLIGGGLNYQWHPLGQALYYQYPNNARWYRFDPATGRHEVMGRLPDGQWSRDGRYRVQWISLGGDEYRQFVEQRRILPKVSVWDSQTGLTRRYCIPESGIANAGSSLLWSPDNRYLSFRMNLPAEGDTWPVLYTPTPQDPTPTPLPRPTAIPLETQYEYQRARTLVLDTQTGTVTIITDQANDALVWTGEAQ